MSRDFQRAFLTASSEFGAVDFFAAHPGSEGVDPSQMRSIALRGRNGFALDDRKLTPACFRTIGRAARCDGEAAKAELTRVLCARSNLIVALAP